MSTIKLTKNELRSQQTRLVELKKYLPTLQLKKAMLQTEVNEARAEISECRVHFEKMHVALETYSSLLTLRLPFDLQGVVAIREVLKRYDNIAGIEVPCFESITFNDVEYSLFDSPPWVDSVIQGLRGLAEASVRIQIAQEKQHALEVELRDVSIKVNLFEKMLIPRAESNIKKIKVFIGDQQLAAVSQAKAAKSKIEAQKLLSAQRRTLIAVEGEHAD